MRFVFLFQNEVTTPVPSLANVSQAFLLYWVFLRNSICKLHYIISMSILRLLLVLLFIATMLTSSVNTMFILSIFIIFVIISMIISAVVERCRDYRERCPVEYRRDFALFMGRVSRHSSTMFLVIMVFIACAVCFAASYIAHAGPQGPALGSCYRPLDEPDAMADCLEFVYLIRHIHGCNPLDVWGGWRDDVWGGWRDRRFVQTFCNGSFTHFARDFCFRRERDAFDRCQEKKYKWEHRPENLDKMLVATYWIFAARIVIIVLTHWPKPVMMPSAADWLHFVLTVAFQTAYMDSMPVNLTVIGLESTHERGLVEWMIGNSSRMSSDIFQKHVSHFAKPWSILMLLRCAIRFFDFVCSHIVSCACVGHVSYRCRQALVTATGNVLSVIIVAW